MPRAAASMILLPVDTSPVSEATRMRGSRISGAPTVSPLPHTILTTPGGSMPARISPKRSVVSGVFSEGLSTTVLPMAIAGPSFQAAIIKG